MTDRIINIFEFILNSPLNNMIGGALVIGVIFLCYFESLILKKHTESQPNLKPFLVILSLCWVAHIFLVGGLIYVNHNEFFLEIASIMDSPRDDSNNQLSSEARNSESTVPLKDSRSVKDIKRSQSFILYVVFCALVWIYILAFVIWLRTCKNTIENETEDNFLSFAKQSLLLIISTELAFSVVSAFLLYDINIIDLWSKVGFGIARFCTICAIPLIVGFIAWLTYLANRKSIDRPHFSVFFTDDSLRLHSDVEKERSKKPSVEERKSTENKDKIIEVVPWFAGKHPLDDSNYEEFTVSICIENTPPPGAKFHKGAPGSNVIVFFFMPPNIVPFRAYRRDSVAESRQIWESCEYGLFNDRHYIAVPTAYNVSPPAITMLSKNEAVVVEITSRIEKPLDKDFCKNIQNIGIQITSNEGITSDVKWLYLKFCDMTEDSKDSNTDENDNGRPDEAKDDVGLPLPWGAACDRLFGSLTEDISLGNSLSMPNSKSEKTSEGRPLHYKDGIEWKKAVTRLLNNQSSDFKSLADQLLDEYSTMPGHYKRDPETKKWKEIENANHNYDVLSKLLSSIWYLMDKEFLPSSPNYSQSAKWKIWDELPISSNRYYAPHELSGELGNDLTNYENEMKKYFRYRSCDNEGTKKAITIFYENYAKTQHSYFKNEKDRNRLSEMEKSSYQSAERDKIEKLGGRVREIKTKTPSIDNFLDDFVLVHREQLLELCHNKSNGRSTPQRVFPLANILPIDCSVGVLELGCHRGDIGLALLNLDQILTNPTRYFTKQFQDFIGDERDLRWVCNPIQKYFGVTDATAIDDDWNLAQWGTHREVREKLQKFHYDFRSGGNDRFRKIKADLCDFDSYVTEAVNFFKDMDSLVVLTSYALCFIPLDKRRRLAQGIRAIQKYYKAANPNGKFFWFNQGRSVDEIFNEEPSNTIATRFFLGEMCFKGAFLFGVDLLPLANDLHSGWRAPQFSILCEKSNKEECERFIKTRPSIDDDLYKRFKRYTPSRWNDGLYCIDEGKYDALVNKEPGLSQELSIYSNIVFPMLDRPDVEAGKVQQLLESQKMSYIGSTAETIEALADIDRCRAIWREFTPHNRDEKDPIPALEYYVYDKKKEDESESQTPNNLFQSLLKQFDLEEGESIRIVSAYSGVDRKRMDWICSDDNTFKAEMSKALEKYDKIIIEPRRTFKVKSRETSEIVDKECVIYVPIIETGPKAIALPAYMDEDLKELFFLTEDRDNSSSLCLNRIKTINMAKRLALNAYRAVHCHELGVVEMVYSEKRGLQVSRIQPLPYFWEYSDSNDDSQKKVLSQDIVDPNDLKSCANWAKAKRFCEGFTLPEKVLQNGFFYAWERMCKTRKLPPEGEGSNGAPEATESDVAPNETTESVVASNESAESVVASNETAESEDASSETAESAGSVTVPNGTAPPRKPIDLLLNILCNMAQRNDGDMKRLMHVLWYDKEED